MLAVTGEEIPAEIMSIEPKVRPIDRWFGWLGRGFIGMFLRRLVLLPFTLFIVMTITFLITHVLGGSPAYRLAGPDPTPAAINTIKDQLGLNHPIFVQYWDYLDGIFHGNLGVSFFSHESVVRGVLQSAPATIELVIFGTLFGGILAIVLGLAAAQRRGGIIDWATQSFATLSLSAPVFFVAILLSYFFFYRLHWAPAPIGQSPTNAATIQPITGSVVIDAAWRGQWSTFGEALGLMVLPVATLALSYHAVLYRAIRTSAIEVYQSDFILYAEAMGLSEWAIRRYVVRHALRSAMSYIGIIVSTGVGSAVLVEQVYAWGGLGQYGVTAIQNGDFPSIQGFVLAIALITVLTYLVVDMLYTVIDPRVRVR